MQGKTKAALRLLSDEGRGQVLSVQTKIDPHDPSSPTVLDALKEKHPPAQPVDEEALLSEATPSPAAHPVIFDSLTGEKIRKTVLRCNGSAGSSGLDVAARHRMCTAFRRASNDLCDSIAAFRQKICTTELDGDSLSAYVACHLIALDKSPGVRPIGEKNFPNVFRRLTVLL